jgi:hypothetical protein
MLDKRWTREDRFFYSEPSPADRSNSNLLCNNVYLSPGNTEAALSTPPVKTKVRVAATPKRRRGIATASTSTESPELTRVARKGRKLRKRRGIGNIGSSELAGWGRSENERRH